MSLEDKLKTTLIEDLKLEDLDPEEITDETPLFGEGLGLDSLDAVELVVILQKRFDIEVKDMDEGREAFQTIRSLADFIRAKRGEQG